MIHCAECVRLGMENEELRKAAEADKRRLDWLDGDNFWDFCRSANPADPSKTFHLDVRVGEEGTMLSASTARACIDAALATAQQEEKS